MVGNPTQIKKLEYLKIKNKIKLPIPSLSYRDISLLSGYRSLSTSPKHGKACFNNIYNILS